MKLSEFSSYFADSPNKAKTFLNILLGYYAKEEALPAILALYESFPEEYKKQTKVFAPTFLKLINAVGMNEALYPYYVTFSKHYSADNIKHIHKNNPQWKWNTEGITFKNSLELAKTLYSIQNEYDYETQRYGKAVPFFKEHASEIERLIQKDKDKLVLNFFKKDVWKFLIGEDYLFMKDFCHEHEINVIDILQTVINGTAYNGCGFEYYLGANAQLMPLTQFKEMLSDIKKFDEEDFFHSHHSVFFQPPNQNLQLCLSECVLYAFCFNHIEHAGLLAHTFHEQMLRSLPDSITDIYDNEMWLKYCEDRKEYSGSSYGISSNELECMDENVMNNIGSLLKTIGLKHQLETSLSVTEKKKLITKI